MGMNPSLSVCLSIGLPGCLLSVRPSARPPLFVCVSWPPLPFLPL